MPLPDLVLPEESKIIDPLSYDSSLIDGKRKCKAAEAVVLRRFQHALPGSGAVWCCWRARGALLLCGAAARGWLLSCVAEAWTLGEEVVVWDTVLVVVVCTAHGARTTNALLSDASYKSSAQK